MELSFPCGRHLLLCTVVIAAILLSSFAACAQLQSDSSFLPGKSSIKKILPALSSDSIPLLKKDTLKKHLALSGSRLLKRIKDSLNNAVTVDINNPFDKLFVTRPACKVTAW
jgi:hypothetical protein